MDGIVTIVNGKLKIENRIFEHHELFEAKCFIYQNNFNNLNFIIDSEDDYLALHEVTQKMEKLSPEIVDPDIISFSIN